MTVNAKTPVISVVVPMYNEAENIEVFYERLKKVLDHLKETYEIICVDDGSTDETLKKLLRLRERDPEVKIISLSRNFGKEIALTAGIDFSSGEVVIPIDADLQDPPELIPELLAKWREGYDMVYATRIEREGEGWFKRLTVFLFYWIAEKILSIKIPKNTGDFRLMSRSVVEALKQLRERNRFMKGLFCWVGFSSTAVYYRRESRYAGRTKWNYWKLWKLAVDGIISFSYLPLQLATLFGFISILFSLFLIFKFIFYCDKATNYIILIAVFLGGIQLVCIGILGAYIGRIYDEVKQRPLYIVKQKWGL